MTAQDTLVERLRCAAETNSRIQQGMMEAKSLRQEGNPEGRNDLYFWPTPEQTLEGKAAARIEQLEATLARQTEAETWESINQWCDDTFGPATVPQIIARAKEEFDELEAEGCDPAIEAADVVICLCRIPGFAEALQRKMAINRKRKWRLTGNGTGYHIPPSMGDTP